MIGEALRLIVRELDSALQRQAPGGGSLAALTNLVDANGAAVPEAAEKIAVFIVNILQEDIPTLPAAGRRGDGQTFKQQQPPVHLSLQVMFAANFSGSRYDEALKRISGTIEFFQGRPSFNHRDTPELPVGLDKLTMAIENLGVADLSHVWSIHGGRYLPSVLYRIRVLGIDCGRIDAQPRAVE
ncbi:DUF4255 domain-containing protein [Sandarakinorhabdus sp.]|uniref:DUF4255 domain-containing protein n=1 Tax=Sandarakinorhabdus sp. TaxID=1916663 RepID=UPI00333F882D